MRRQFRSRQANRELHNEYLQQLQELRGRLYLKDGAICEANLSAGGRFRMPGDEDAWHLLLVDNTSRVIGCVRYLVHPSTVQFEHLRLAKSCLALDQSWSEKVRRSVEADLDIVRRNGLCYVEAGGWAISEEWRGTRAALEIAIGSYALGRMWGGALGSCTATARHGSASILRRLGGQSLRVGDETIPPYYDRSYDCSMELLRFDYRIPAERYAPLIEHLTERFSETPVLIAAETPVPCFALLTDVLRPRARRLPGRASV